MSVCPPLVVCVDILLPLMCSSGGQLCCVVSTFCCVCSRHLLHQSVGILIKPPVFLPLSQTFHQTCSQGCLYQEGRQVVTNPRQSPCPRRTRDGPCPWISGGCYLPRPPTPEQRDPEYLEDPTLRITWTWSSKSPFLAPTSSPRLFRR